MKSKKIFAAVLASVCTVAAMSAAASAAPVGAADENTVTEIDTTFTVDGTLEGTALLDAIWGDYELNNYAYGHMTLTSDDPFVFIYPGDISRLNKWIPIEGTDAFGLYVSGLSEDVGAKDNTERVPLPASTLDNLPDTAFVTSATAASYTTGGGKEHWKIMTKNNKKITIKAHLTAPPMGYFTLKDKTEDNSSTTTDIEPGATSGKEPGSTTDTEPGATSGKEPGTTSGSNSSATITIENKFTLKDGKLEGEELVKAIIGDSNNEWKDIQGLTFTSDKPFSVQFGVKAGAINGNDTATTYIMGVSELKKDELPMVISELKMDELPDSAYNTTWTLSDAEIAAMLEGDPTGKSMKIISKDGSDIEVKVTATFKAASGTDNKDTGIALAFAPVILAGAAVIAVNVAKKRR